MIQDSVLLCAYLQGSPPNPGTTYTLMPGAEIALPLPATCVVATHDEVLGQYVAVYRMELARERNSVGLIMKAGTVVYLRVHSSFPPAAQKGQRYPDGQQIVFPANAPQQVTLAVRVGGKDGITSWDAGEVRAVLDHPARPGYGYPVPHAYLRRAVALRFADPAVLGLAYPYPFRLL